MALTVAYTSDFRLYGKKERTEDINWAIEQIDPDYKYRGQGVVQPELLECLSTY
jgi:hypothetical protein